jgi:phosphoglycolate phosphatase
MVDALSRDQLYARGTQTGMKALPRPPSGVFFDLDGTLLDSAPGLHVALQMYCRELGVPAPAYAGVRQVVSRGARAVLRTAFPQADDTAIGALGPRYLDLYAGVMGAHTRFFDGVESLLAALQIAGIPWGVVTNKPGFLTDPLLAQLGLVTRAAAVVSGDTLATRKPDPAPVLHACALAGVDAATAVFVGDDLRDVQAGRAAGLYAVAAAWGYLDGGDPRAWEADAVVDTPQQLTRLLALPVPAT